MLLLRLQTRAPRSRAAIRWRAAAQRARLARRRPLLAVRAVVFAFARARLLPMSAASAAVARGAALLLVLVMVVVVVLLPVLLLLLCRLLLHCVVGQRSHAPVACRARCAFGDARALLLQCCWRGRCCCHRYQTYSSNTPTHQHEQRVST
jgi:hypothetical protein